MQQIGKLLLESKGYEVLLAGDGFEGLLALKQSLPDIIISDLSMPNMNGFEFLSVVRRRFPIIPVIVISGQFSGTTVPESEARVIPFASETMIVGLCRDCSWWRQTSSIMSAQEDLRSSALPILSIRIKHPSGSVSGLAVVTKSLPGQTQGDGRRFATRVRESRYKTRQQQASIFASIESFWH